MPVVDRGVVLRVGGCSFKSVKLLPSFTLGDQVRQACCSSAIGRLDAPREVADRPRFDLEAIRCVWSRQSAGCSPLVVGGQG